MERFFLNRFRVPERLGKSVPFNGDTQTEVIDQPENPKSFHNPDTRFPFGKDTQVDVLWRFATPDLHLPASIGDETLGQPFTRILYYPLQKYPTRVRGIFRELFSQSYDSRNQFHAPEKSTPLLRLFDEMKIRTGRVKDIVTGKEQIGTWIETTKQEAFTQTASLWPTMFEKFL